MWFIKRERPLGGARRVMRRVVEIPQLIHARLRRESGGRVILPLGVMPIIGEIGVVFNSIPARAQAWAKAS